MPKVIESVEIIHQHPEGPDLYKVGNFNDVIKNEKIGDITEIAGNFLIFNDQDEIITEIRNNVPVVVRYTDAPEED